VHEAPGYLYKAYPNGAVCNASGSAACTLGWGTDEETGRAALGVFGAATLVAGGVVAYPVVADFLTPGVVVIGDTASVRAFLATGGDGVRTFYGTFGTALYETNWALGAAANTAWAATVRFRGDLVINLNAAATRASNPMLWWETIIMGVKSRSHGQ